MFYAFILTQKLALKSFTAKLQPQYVKKIVATMAMQTALSKLIDPKAAAMFSKIDKSSNRWAGIAEVSIYFDRNDKFSLNQAALIKLNTNDIKYADLCGCSKLKLEDGEKYGNSTHINQFRGYYVHG